MIYGLSRKDDLVSELAFETFFANANEHVVVTSFRLDGRYLLAQAPLVPSAPIHRELLLAFPA